MSTEPFKGQYAELTGWSYSSGEFHGAYDYACPLGTPIFAVNEGHIIDCCDGIRNNPPGYSGYTGAPSNWILLGTNAEPFGKVTVFYQHLSPGLEVHRGQKIKEGQLLGHSGNSGHTTGPHLHIASMKGWQTNRYAYMASYGHNPIIIYPPTRVWRNQKEDDVVTHEEMQNIARMAGNEAKESIMQALLWPDVDDKELKKVTVRDGLQVLTRFMLNNRAAMIEHLHAPEPVKKP